MGGLRWCSAMVPCLARGYDRSSEDQACRCVPEHRAVLQPRLHARAALSALQFSRRFMGTLGCRPLVSRSSDIASRRSRLRFLVCLRLRERWSAILRRAPQRFVECCGDGVACQLSASMKCGRECSKRFFKLRGARPRSRSQAVAVTALSASLFCSRARRVACRKRRLACGG